MNPIYLYGTVDTPEVGDGALYHYTKFKSFLEILESMKLRSSPLSGMNDLNEANLSGLNWNSDFLLMMKAQEYILNKCSIICFSQNYESDSGCQEGSNHPALWAHYADEAKGVCIVLDEKKFLDINRELLGDKFYRLEDVEYTSLHSPDEKVSERKYSSVSEFVRLNNQELFYKKHPDWSYEGERRLLIESAREELNIKGAIKHIVLGKKLLSNESDMKRLISQIISPTSLSYKYISARSFASISNSCNGYLTEPAVADIERYLHEMIIVGELEDNILNDFIAGVLP